MEVDCLSLKLILVSDDPEICACPRLKLMSGVESVHSWFEHNYDLHSPRFRAPVRFKGLAHLSITSQDLRESSFL